MIMNNKFLRALHNGVLGPRLFVLLYKNTIYIKKKRKKVAVFHY